MFNPDSKRGLDKIGQSEVEDDQAKPRGKAPKSMDLDISAVIGDHSSLTLEEAKERHAAIRGIRAKINKGHFSRCTSHDTLEVESLHDLSAYTDIGLHGA